MAKSFRLFTRIRFLGENNNNTVTQREVFELRKATDHPGWECLDWKSFQKGKFPVHLRQVLKTKEAVNKDFTV